MGSIEIFTARSGGGAGFYNAYVKVSHTVATTVLSGTFTAGSRQTRTINLEDSDDQNICSIAANVITLEAGVYDCHILNPALNVARHQSFLYDVTGTADLLIGSCCDSAGGTDQNDSFIIGQFELLVQSGIRIEHECQVTNAINGFGIAGNFGGSEVYGQAVFRRRA